MSEGLWGPLMTGAVTILFGWVLANGLKTGTMEFPCYGITLSGRRSDQPVRFWVTTLLVAFMTFVTALATIGQIFLPHGL